MARHELDDLAGVGELALELGVSRQAISNWAKRHESFPKPLRIFQMGPIYSRKAVHSWIRVH